MHIQPWKPKMAESVKIQSGKKPQKFSIISKLHVNALPLLNGLREIWCENFIKTAKIALLAYLGKFHSQPPKVIRFHITKVIITKSGKHKK